jgi:hypothetical protein
MKRNLNPPMRVNIGARAKKAPRSRSGAERWTHSLCSALPAGALVFLTTPAAAVKVRVLAATHIEARIERDPTKANDVVLRGILRDDVGAPIPNSHVSISLHGEGGKGPALPLPRAERCSPALAPDAHDPHVAPEEYVVDTDAAGGFCVHGEAVLLRGVMRLRFQGSAFLERSEEDVCLICRPPVKLAFAPASVVSLDRPTYVQGLRVVARSFAHGDWHVTLRDERQKVLGTAVADRDVMRASKCAPKISRNRERAHTERRSTTPLSAVTHAIERHARVDLDLDDPRWPASRKMASPSACARAPFAATCRPGSSR